MADLVDKKKGWTLSINPALPEFPFKEQYFEVVVYLQDAQDQLKCAVEVPLKFRLDFASEGHQRLAAPEHLLKLETEDAVIDRKTGSARVKCKVAACSMDFENKAFVLVASASGKKGQFANVADAVSTPMKVMRLKLTIDVDPNWEEVWFKDEGGREKCICLTARLVDHEHKAVTNRAARLKVVLHYADSYLPVTSQDILKLAGEAPNHTLGAPELRIDKGVCKIRLRIEDVSKNHQGQSFRIKIGPDSANSPTDCDIAHAFSNKVAVRSKRNKRAAQATRTTTTTTAQHHPSAETMYAKPAGRNNHTRSQSPPPDPARPSHVLRNGHAQAFAGEPGGGATTRTGRPQRAAAARASVLDKDHLYAAAGPSSAAAAAAAAREEHNNINTPAGLMHSPSLRGATRATMEWVFAACDALKTMRWQVVGYERQADGTSRPHYEFVKPNDLIDRLLVSYDEDVAPSVERLAHRVNNEEAALGDDGMPDPAQPIGDADLRRQYSLAAGAPSAAAPPSKRPRHSSSSSSAADAAPDETCLLARPEPLSASMRMRTSVAGVYDIISQLSPPHHASDAAAALATTFQSNVSPFALGSSTAAEAVEAAVASSPSSTAAAAGLQQMASAAAQLPPPALLSRGVSSLYTASDLTATRVSQLRPRGAGPEGDRPASLAEQSVQLIVAKGFKPARRGAVPLGFPAFDADKRFLGLYREAKTDDNATSTYFLPRDADKKITGLEPGDADLAELALQDELKAGSDSVHRLADHKTQERLKEAAYIYHWSKEAFCDEIIDGDQPANNATGNPGGAAAS